jgi:hypothetical protein
MLLDVTAFVSMQLVLERRPKPQPKPANKQAVPQKPAKPKAADFQTRARPP